tara:strand:+ start:3987 stop:4439 length:453 start_codon:yes stop_codon:yes gene_type:complete
LQQIGIRPEQYRYPKKQPVQIIKFTLCTGSNTDYLNLLWLSAREDNNNIANGRRSFIMGIASSHALAATRNNLFGLQSNALPLFGEGVNISSQWLEDLGFSVLQPSQEHWVVKHHNPLPELHFYSEHELAEFASYKAHHYAKRLLPENRT